jgi:cell division septation protein DedD
MARNEGGEFELVLGNRQLLSLAAIVVILFGIFFTMGYIVGRNSTPISEAAGANAGNVSEGRPEPMGSRVAPPTQEPPASEPAPQATQPAQPEPEPPPAQIKPEPAKEEPATAAAAADSPQAGQTYLQLTALARRDAEIVVDALRKKGFPALLAEAPNGLFRVLVGPYPDRDALGKAKSDLEAAGFKNAFVRKM